MGASQLGRPRIADGSESVLLGVEFAELHLRSEPKQELRVDDSGECISSDKVRRGHPKFKKISLVIIKLRHQKKNLALIKNLLYAGTDH